MGNSAAASDVGGDKHGVTGSPLQRVPMPRLSQARMQPPQRMPRRRRACWASFPGLLGAPATTPAEGSGGSDAGASGGGAEVAALVGSTTAVAAGESGVCLSQADSNTATASAMNAERGPMNPPVASASRSDPCWSSTQCAVGAASARNGTPGEKRDACEVGAC